MENKETLYVIKAPYLTKGKRIYEAGFKIFVVEKEKNSRSNYADHYLDHKGKKRKCNEYLYNMVDGSKVDKLEKDFSYYYNSYEKAIAAKAKALMLLVDEVDEYYEKMKKLAKEKVKHVDELMEKYPQWFC